MKKVISMFLILVMLIISFPVLADTKVSEDMQSALTKVKTLVNVNPELSEFSSYMTTSGDKKSYTFEWRNTGYSKSMTVSYTCQKPIKF